MQGSKEEILNSTDNLRFQSIEQLWPSSIYALDTRWWSGNGHLLHNENYHKKLRKKIMLCFNSKCWVLSIRRCCFGQFTLYNTYTSSFYTTKIYKKLQKYERKQKIHNATIFQKKPKYLKLENWMKLFLHQQTFCIFGFMDVLSTAVTIHTCAGIWIQLYYFWFVKMFLHEIDKSYTIHQIL